MAYLSNQEEENTGVGMNVLNPAQDAQNQGNQPVTPQTSGSTPQGQEQGSQSPSGASPMAPGAAQAGVSPSPTTPASAPSSQRRKTQPRASSGTFTNIRKYVEANKPAASNISNQVNRQFGSQAQNLQQQAQRRAEMFGSQVQQRQNVLEGERQAARDVASQVIGSQAPQAGQESQSLVNEDQYGRIRNLITGQTQFDDVQDLNLAREQNKAAELQRVANAASTEAGRADLLKRTFGGGTRDYTRGQQGLDALVLQGDEGARRQLIEGLQSSAQQTGQNVDDLRRQALQNVAQYRQDRSNIGQSVSDIIQSQGADVLSGQIDEKVAQEMAKREALAGQLGVASGDLDAFIRQTGANLDPTSIRDRFEHKFTRDGYQEGTMAAELTPDQVNQLVFDALGKNRGELTARQWLNTERQNYSQQIGGVRGAAQARARQFAENIQQERDQAAMDAALGRLYGQAEEGRGLEDLQRLRAGEDVARGTVVEEGDIARYNALQDLLQGRNIGEREFKTGVTPTGVAQGETESLQGFYQNLLDRLSQAKG